MCSVFSQLDDADEVVQPVDVDDEVHGAVLNFGPGRFGFRWGWQD